MNEWIAKTYAEAGTGSVVTMGEARRRLIVPVAIDGEIPIELPPELDIVRSIQIELHSSRLRKGRQQFGVDGQGGLVETEQVQFRSQYKRLTYNLPPRIPPSILARSDELYENRRIIG